MRTLKTMAAIGLMTGFAVSTTACVETVDQGYGNYGYGDGSYAPSQAYYASSPAYYAPAPTYYAPTQVVTQTRYVPVPVAVPQHSFTQQQPASNGWHEHRQAANTPPALQPQPPQPSSGSSQHHGTGHGDWHGDGHDRNGDGRPDRNN
jgi:hypothetical protein